MHIACWILKATNTYSEYALFIDFPMQQWLHEHASKIRDAYIVCLIMNYEIHAFRTYLQKCAIRTRSLATGKRHVILHLQRKAANNTTNTPV
jgi:hypothetical protein